jgi:signal transduction histidine kinase
VLKSVGALFRSTNPEQEPIDVNELILDAIQVFDAFVTTKATGMGLGLALSQMIIERHGGQIIVAPSANDG